jgi:hypothetical protein
MEAFLFIDVLYNIQFFGASSPSRLKTATRKTGPRRRFRPSRRVTTNYNFFSQKFKERAQFPDFSGFTPDAPKDRARRSGRAEHSSALSMNAPFPPIDIFPY